MNGSYIHLISAQERGMPADSDRRLKEAPPGFGALLEAMSSSEEDQEQAEDRQKREAHASASAVGMSTVGCQPDGGGQGRTPDRPPESEPRQWIAQGPMEKQGSSNRQKQDERLTHKHSTSVDLLSNEKSSDTELNDDAQANDRAMVSILEELVRRLHATSLAAKPSTALVVRLGELGEVKINVRFAGKNMLVRAEVANPVAAAALTSAVPDLKARLAALGWRLGRLEIFEAGRVETGSTQKGQTDSLRPGVRGLVAHEGALDVVL